MSIAVSGTVSVCLLATMCAVSPHHLPDDVDIRTRRMDLATAKSRGRRAVSRHWPMSSDVDARTTTGTRSGRQLHGATSNDEARRRSRRGMIVNGFTGWDYEPLELGAFRTRRG